MVWGKKKCSDVIYGKDKYWECIKHGNCFYAISLSAF